MKEKSNGAAPCKGGPTNENNSAIRINDTATTAATYLAGLPCPERTGLEKGFSNSYGMACIQYL